MLYRAGALTAIHIPDRAGRGGARSAAVSRGHPRRSAARAASALEVSPAPWPALHRHEEGVDETPRRVAARPDVAAARARPDAPRLSPRGRRSRSPASRAVETDLRALLTLEPVARRVAAAALLPRHRRSDRADDRRRTRRSAPLCHGAAARWPLSASSRPSTRAAPNARRAASPKPATPICGACSSKPPGTIAIIRSSAPPSARASAGAPATVIAAGVDRATAAASSLPAVGGPRQTQTAHRHRGRPRAHRLCVGRPDPVI